MLWKPSFSLAGKNDVRRGKGPVQQLGKKIADTIVGCAKKEMWELNVRGIMEKFGALDVSEKTIVIPGVGGYGR